MIRLQELELVFGHTHGRTDEWMDRQTFLILDGKDSHFKNGKGSIIVVVLKSRYILDV